MEPVNRYLDHAVLKPQLKREEARAAIALGRDHKVRQVCVRPADIGIALELCRGTGTAVGTVLSFPHGTGHPEGKAAEARVYMALGVQEIDMVANYGLILSGAWDDVRRDIEAVSFLTRPKGVLLKVILETSELDLPSIRRATAVAAEAGADFVKTSTGFASGSATEEAVRAMIEAAAGRIGVKASGGIRDRPRADLFLGMGCLRLGVNYPSTPVICGQPGKDAPTASTRPAGGY